MRPGRNTGNSPERRPGRNTGNPPGGKPGRNTGDRLRGNLAGTQVSLWGGDTWQEHSYLNGEENRQEH